MFRAIRRIRNTVRKSPSCFAFRGFSIPITLRNLTAGSDGCRKDHGNGVTRQGWVSSRPRNNAEAWEWWNRALQMSCWTSRLMKGAACRGTDGIRRHYYWSMTYKVFPHIFHIERGVGGGYRLIPAALFHNWANLKQYSALFQPTCKGETHLHFGSQPCPQPLCTPESLHLNGFHHPMQHKQSNQQLQLDLQHKALITLAC